MSLIDDDQAVGGIVSAALVGPVLGVIGFTAAGVGAGTAAAGIQAGIGNVAAGSLFAAAQGAAAGGGAAAVFQGVAAAGGAVGAGLVALFA
ncbi:hypothetical protein F5884DRAFT_856689 [Xylogone sp. PMI_703]|nr:hypothetical protein F5884DRAFT_856689 [Xylogone sp. PMI_703]